MKKTTTKVLVPHPLFGKSKRDPELVELEAYATKVPGLVVLKGRPYFDHGGTLRFGRGYEIRLTDGRLVVNAEGELLLPLKEVIARANAMTGPDWGNVPPGEEFSNQAVFGPYVEAAIRGWLGEAAT